MISSSRVRSLSNTLALSASFHKLGSEVIESSSSRRRRALSQSKIPLELTLRLLDKFGQIKYFGFHDGNFSSGLALKGTSKLALAKKHAAMKAEKHEFILNK